MAIVFFCDINNYFCVINRCPKNQYANSLPDKRLRNMVANPDYFSDPVSNQISDSISRFHPDFQFL